MSLDIAVLSDEETIDRHVPIGVEAHHRLMRLCEDESFELMARIRDYYAEAEIFPQELGKFVGELHNARGRAERDPELAKIIDELVRLAEFAKEATKSVVAIPD